MYSDPPVCWSRGSSASVTWWLLTSSLQSRHCLGRSWPEERESGIFHLSPRPALQLTQPTLAFFTTFLLEISETTVLWDTSPHRVTCVVSLCLWYPPYHHVTCACVLSWWQSLTDSSLCQCAQLTPGAPPPSTGPRQLPVIRAEPCITVLHLSLNRLARVRLLPVTSMPAQRNWWYMNWAGLGSAALA